MVLRIVGGVVAVLAIVGIVIGTRMVEPIVMVPGGTLAGEERPAPSDWAWTDAVEFVQLETRLDDSYSVNLWGVGLGADFYVATDSAGTGWTSNLERDPVVRLRIENSLYRLNAVRVEDGGELQRVLEGYAAKYPMNTDELSEVLGRAYRLDRP